MKIENKKFKLVFVTAFLTIFFLLGIDSRKVSGQITPIATPQVCVTCAEPLCTSGQILSVPDAPCSECPKCIDDCKCPDGERFDGERCINNSEGVVCILLYDPVCGCNGKTYSNSCFAAADGVKKFTQGECGSSSSSGELTCTIDSDCPPGICPDGYTYQNFSCLEGKCHQLNFFADPCLLHSSINKNFSGIWRGRIDRKPGQRFLSPVLLKLCVRNGKITETVHIPKILESAVIVSQNIISENIIELTVTDRLNNSRLLTLELLNRRIISGVLDSGETFKVRKISAPRNCIRPGSSSTSSSSSSSSSGGINDCSSRGSCHGPDSEELPCPPGTECSGLPASGCFPPGCPVPICLSPDTKIRTNGVQKRIADIKKGDIVLSDEEKPVKVIKINSVEVKQHKILRILFNDATVLEISPNHPTADGRLFKDLKMGDVVDGRLVVETKSIPYKYKYTYDILPDSMTGYYYANGILIGSTLKQ